MTQIDPTSASVPIPSPPQAASAPASHSGFSFHDFLSIINPLQHIPVIGTLYRAITGDTIGVPEKIAGDALFGGVWGAISGVADAAFQAVTGKDFGDTVLALFTGHHGSATAVAGNSDIAPVTVTSGVTLPADPNVVALTASLQQKGVDSTLAQRAILAYRKSMTLTDMALAAR